MAEMCKEFHFDITIEENKLTEGATDIVKLIRPTWPADRYRSKLFTNGLSNNLIGVWCEGHYEEMVMVRVYGHKSDLFIDRAAETRNIRLLHDAGYTHCLYATFNNGLAYQFLPGDVLTTESVRSPSVYKLVAKRLAEMHKLNPINPEISRDPFIWNKTENFMSIMPKSFPDVEKQAKFQKIIRPYVELEKEYKLTKEELKKLNSAVVFAHNDLLLGNVLYDNVKNTVTFIDFEYTAYNYQAYDIGNHFAEFVGLDVSDYSLYPDESFQRDWLRSYLEEYNVNPDVTEAEITKLYTEVNKFVVLTHFFWGCWALIQSEHSIVNFDFLEYASIRFNEYFKQKHRLFS